MSNVMRLWHIWHCCHHLWYKPLSRWDCPFADNKAIVITYRIVSCITTYNVFQNVLPHFCNVLSTIEPVMWIEFCVSLKVTLGVLLSREIVLHRTTMQVFTVESTLRKCRLLHLNGYASVTACSYTRIDHWEVLVISEWVQRIRSLLG